MGTKAKSDFRFSKQPVIYSPILKYKCRLYSYKNNEKSHRYFEQLERWLMIIIITCLNVRKLKYLSNIEMSVTSKCYMRILASGRHLSVANLAITG